MNIVRHAAIAAALAFCGLAQAQSSVTVYGVVSQDAVRVTGVYRAASKTFTKLYALDNGALTASRLGFKGSEDLGGGLAATFGLESGLSPDTGTATSTFWNRGSTVGLKGSFGAVTFGRQWNINDDMMWEYFMFGGYAVFRYTEFDWVSDLTNNSIKYVAPRIGCFQAEALVAFGEQARGISYGSTGEIGGSCKFGDFSGAISYHKARGLTTNNYDKLTTAGVNYKLGDVRGRLGYAYSAFDASGFKKAAAWDVGVDYTVMPPLALSLDYVARDQRGTSNDSYFVRFLAVYSLSKRTSFNVNLITLHNKGTATEHFYGDGAPGKKQNLVSLGIQHLF
jgi:predicted porin